MECWRNLVMRIPSVCLSVRPSVYGLSARLWNACIVTKQKKRICLDFIPLPIFGPPCTACWRARNNKGLAVVDSDSCKQSAELDSNNHQLNTRRQAVYGFWLVNCLHQQRPLYLPYNIAYFNITFSSKINQSVIGLINGFATVDYRTQ